MVRARKPSSEPKQQTNTAAIEISEDEQWRLINATGVLEKMPQTSRSRQDIAEEHEVSLAEEIFNAVILIMPMSFLLLLMEMYVLAQCYCSLLADKSSLIHFQYGKHPTLQGLVDRMVSGVPSMCCFQPCIPRIIDILT